MPSVNVDTLPPAVANPTNTNIHPHPAGTPNMENLNTHPIEPVHHVEFGINIKITGESEN
jgi:hypothetical protein